MSSKEYEFLSPSVISKIRISIKYLQPMVGLPVRWNDGTSRLELIPRRLTPILYLNYALTLGHVLFVWTRCYQALHDPMLTETTKLVSVYMCIWWWFHLMTAWAFQLARKDFVQYINLGIRFLKECGRSKLETRHRLTTPWATKLHELICNAGHNGIVVNFLLFTLWAFLEPYSPTRLGSLLFTGRNKEAILHHRLLSALFIAYQQWLFSAMTIIEIVTITGLLVGLLAADAEFRHSYFADQDTLPESIQFYSEMHICMRLFNNVFAPMILPSAQVFFVLTCTFGFFGIVHFKTHVAVTLGFLGFYTYWCTVVVFRMPAGFHLRSVEILTKWKRLASSPYDRRVQRAAREWRVECGPGFVDAQLVLTVTGVILNVLVNLLLVTGNGH